MKKGRYKLYMILSLVVAFGGLAAVLIAGWAPRQGLDLAGGVSIIMTAKGEGATNDEVLDKTVSIIRERIDAIGVAEPEVSRAGTSNILIQLPGVDDEEALELIGTTAQLTFRQVIEQIPATPPPNQKNAPETPEITEEVGSEVNFSHVSEPSSSKSRETDQFAPVTGSGTASARVTDSPVSSAGARRYSTPSSPSWSLG